MQHIPVAMGKDEPMQEPSLWTKVFTDPRYVSYAEILEPKGAQPDDEEPVEVQVGNPVLCSQRRASTCSTACTCNPWDTLTLCMQPAMREMCVAGHRHGRQQIEIVQPEMSARRQQHSFSNTLDCEMLVRHLQKARSNARSCASCRASPLHLSSMAQFPCSLPYVSMLPTGVLSRIIHNS